MSYNAPPHQANRYFCKVKLLIRFIDLFLYTSLFTACCAMGLCMATERLINSVSPAIFSHMHMLVFGSTLLVYNTPRVVKRKKNSYTHWYIFFFAVGIILTIFGLYWQSLTVAITSCILGIFAFSYFLPVLPFGSKKRLRDFGSLKITVLACVWTIATSVLPMLYWDKTITDFPFEILLRFVFIFTLCIIFDLRDIQTDLRNNIHTLPQKVGVANSYRLINLALILFSGLSIYQYVRYPYPGRLAGALITAIATWRVANYLGKKPTDRAYLLLADGVMVLYAIVVLA